MKIKYILSLVCLITFYTSCSKDTDPVLPNYSASVLTHPENGSLYELDKTKAKEEVLSFNWTASIQEGLAVNAQSYYLQVDIVGRNFASAVKLKETVADTKQTASTTYTTSVTVKELNVAIVKNLGMLPDSLVNVEFRIITHLGNTVIASSASNTFTAKVIPYDLVAESLFFVGDMFGVNEWNNSSDQFILFRSSPDATTDTYTGKFLEGKGFKLIDAPNLGTWDAYGSDAKNTLTANGGGNITGFDETGYYTVNVNIEDLSYSIESYDANKAATYTSISLTGTGSDIALTQATYDPHIWSTEVTLTAGNVTFKTTDKTWGGKTFPYGGGSEDAITVEAGKYYVAFNDLNGYYVFYNKEK